MKAIILILLAAALARCGLAKAETLTARSFPASEPYVKLTGRTAESGGVRWLIHSASKVEFCFTGTRASIVIAGDRSVSQEETTRARYAVYVNGRRTIDRLVSQAEETVEIFSAEEETTVEIAVVKLSEAANSVFGIRRIDATAAGDIRPVPAKALRIEFIGDSITCGYGVDDENPEHPFATGTEDATKSYAWKTAAALDADYSFVSYSGHGIISGYSGDGNRVPSQLVPPVYEQLGKNYGSAASVIDLSQPWDFSRFQPDIVVINLGTNDASFVRGQDSLKEEYTAAYAAFLRMVRRRNPDALIIAALGVMGDDLFPCVEDAAARYSADTGDTNLKTLRFRPQDGSTGYAADWHPTEATQAIAAETLTRLIASLIQSGASGRP